MACRFHAKSSATVTLRDSSLKHVNVNDLENRAVSHNAPVRKRVMLRYDEVPGVTQFARAVLPPGAVVAPHSHADMTEVFLCDGGRGTITVDGKVIELASGICVVVEPGEVHELRASDDGEMVLTYWGVVTPPQAM